MAACGGSSGSVAQEQESTNAASEDTTEESSSDAAVASPRESDQPDSSVAATPVTSAQESDDSAPPIAADIPAGASAEAPPRTDVKGLWLTGGGDTVYTYDLTDRTVSQHARQPGPPSGYEGDWNFITDVAPAPQSGGVLLGLCCEPASGAFRWMVDGTIDDQNVGVGRYLSTNSTRVSIAFIGFLTLFDQPLNPDIEKEPRPGNFTRIILEPNTPAHIVAPEEKTLIAAALSESNVYFAENSGASQIQAVGADATGVQVVRQSIESAGEAPVVANIDKPLCMIEASDSWVWAIVLTETTHGPSASADGPSYSRCPPGPLVRIDVDTETTRELDPSLAESVHVSVDQTTGQVAVLSRNGSVTILEPNGEIASQHKLDIDLNAIAWRYRE